MISKEFTSKLGLKNQDIILGPTTSGASVRAVGPNLVIPGAYFSNEVRLATDQDFYKTLESHPKELQDLVKAEIEKITTICKKHLTLKEHELRFPIGHEVGHSWLSSNCKAFTSESRIIRGKQVVELKHDKTLEKLCDFIGAYLSAPQSGVEFMNKISELPLKQPDPETDPHPSLQERCEYLQSWIDNPRLKQPLTIDLIREIGGDTFKEALPIYEEYGRSY